MKWKFYKPTFEYEKMYLDLGGPWSGHKYFAYDLMRNFKPKKVVELGTHLGCSLFSFSQAAKDGKLDTQIAAVDTWEGDSHTGGYDETILNKVKEIQNTHYSKQKVRLIKKTFDQALEDFSDNSIDLLHIDGYHTYKAVNHDYYTWVDKVKSDGIILLHDTFVRDAGFGIHKLLKEIKEKHKTIEFTHSYGLGVIFKSEETYKKVKYLSPLLPLCYQLIAEKQQLSYDLNNEKQFLTTNEKRYIRIYKKIKSKIKKLIRLK